MTNQQLARKKEKLVSFLMPTRKRIDIAKESIQSIIDTADNIQDIEILLRLDLDDYDSLKRLKELQHDEVDIVVVVGERYGGYSDLHIHMNELCAISRGEFLFLWNDDSTLEQNSWDSKIKEFSGQVVVLNPKTKDKADYLNTFPILSRKIYEHLGHLSLQTHNDTWIQEVSRRIGIERVVPEIIIHHDRADKTGNNDDEVWKERLKGWQKSRNQFDEHFFVDLRNKDMLKLSEII